MHIEGAEEFSEIMLCIICQHPGELIRQGYPDYAKYNMKISHVFDLK